MNGAGTYTGTSGGQPKLANDQLVWIGLPPIVPPSGYKPDVLGAPIRREWPDIALPRIQTETPPAPKKDMLSRTLEIAVPVVLILGVVGLAGAIVK